METGMKKEIFDDVVEFLRELGDGAMPPGKGVYVGICGNLVAYGEGVGMHSCGALCAVFALHPAAERGSMEYVCPKTGGVYSAHPYPLGVRVYYGLGARSTNKWVGVQGARRRAWCHWLADWLEDHEEDLLAEEVANEACNDGR